MKNNITVSELFMDIYTKFNVVNQTSEMNKLSRFELYLLLTLAVDKFNEDDPVVWSNFSSFITELTEIFDVQDDKETIDTDLLELINRTDDKYIDTDIIVDKEGNKLPEPLQKDEVRELKINLLDI
jgi:hypothetical protein